MFASSSTTRTRVSATPPWCHRLLWYCCERPEGGVPLTDFLAPPRPIPGGGPKMTYRSRSGRDRMMQGRLLTGVAVVTAVAAGGVGGALIGVPALSGAQPFPKSATSAAATD